jgi:NIPSNAP
MYRHRIRQQILYGQFREYMQVAEEVMALREKLGLAASTLWAPTFGTANEVVWEIDYPDLAAYQRENEAFYSDPEVMKQWRRLWQHAVQGSIHDELLEEAPQIA